MNDQTLRPYRRLLANFKGHLKRKVLRICRKQPVHVLHIGKTGGTAIQHALRPHGETGLYAIQFHPHGVKLRDIPRGEKVIFFLRDPVSRFTSGFYSRSRQGQPRYLVPWSSAEKAAFTEFETPNSLAKAISSKSEDTKQRAAMAMNAIYHVRHSYWRWFENESYFHARLPDILFIGFQENLCGDFELLKLKLGLPQQIELPNDDIQAHRSPRCFNHQLEETAIGNLKAWYAKDYQFFQLCKEKAQEINARASSR